jgi:hypothetical protein
MSGSCAKIIKIMHFLDMDQDRAMDGTSDRLWSNGYARATGACRVKMKVLVYKLEQFSD